MESTIWFTDGFVVITGEIGSARPPSLNPSCRRSNATWWSRRSAQTQVSVVDFLQAVLVQFGFSPSR